MSRTAACTFIVLLALVGTAAAVRGPAAAASIDDFEDRDLIAATGSAWIPIGDDLLGGKSILRLEAIRGGSDGSRGALRLSGTLGDGADSFGGAWTAVAEGGRATDVSRFSGLRLRLRGAGDVQVGVRGGPFAKSVNFMARVKAGSDWSTVEIPFSSLQPQGKGLESERWGRARPAGSACRPSPEPPVRSPSRSTTWRGPVVTGPGGCRRPRRGSLRPPAP